MTKAIEQKKETVDKIAMKLQNSKTTVVTDYRGLTVQQTNQLRKQLREANVELQVLKNTLTRRATEQVGLSELNTALTGPSAVAFSNEDVIAPARILQRFAREHKALEIKGGVVEGRVVGIEEIKALADLPPLECLLSMLLSVLQAPMRNFALAVKAVADNGSETVPDIT
jgi:large subunit ribosomal protein L10